MKKTLVAFVIVGLIGAVSAQASSPKERAAKAPTKMKSAQIARERIYITNIPCTGSHLPLVVTRYGGYTHANSSFIAYSHPELDRTGQLSVFGELNQRDPSISSVGRVR